MRIGLTGGGTSVDSMVRQAQQAEADGFASLWYASAVAGDPLVAMAFAGRSTTSIELGTAVLQTYPCHPLLQANRTVAAANAMGRPGLTLGLGPSHRPIVEDVLGLSYDRPARHTEEYVRIVTALLRDGNADFDGADWTTHSAGRMAAAEHAVPVLLAALSPRMLRVAGSHADGVILWLASAAALERSIMPVLSAAADAAGRPAPRVVAGLPVAVHNDRAEAEAAVAATATGYGAMPNFEQIVATGGGSSAADVAIIGDEASVQRQLERLITAGATDIWAQPVAVGADREQRRSSLRRTRALLSALARQPD
ncbi:TIGR03564 family F420-dependent LLM class oxidoreductase [[Mycobacterium] wendilense]|uniref:TIGR03564 family F420-dependent LLM class oxidoreductase n=1 Tax=[Mycobacterium] wendilense TaxID=3064284 RepID=A0ABM9MBH3_9MYCO|nr:TIGR03564 family F420-dependent LLM class oxidoreductase [Mycolicibacterium sp. MU0050]CAJ1581185.1 TIGR03564 family F420-dependent LLM class oxidoreductase [Mycolicibacterium sp. MU0050]